MTIARLDKISKMFPASERGSAISTLLRKNIALTETTALEDFSLDIAEGEILRLAGLNGSGKTTLLRILAGIVAPTSGNVQLCGHTATILTPHAYFFNRLPLRDSIFFIGACFKMSRRQALAALENFAGPYALDRKAIFLTPGQRTRLLLHLACSSGAKLVLLDEVLSLLDAPSLMDATKELEQLKAAGSAAVLVAHNFSLPTMTREVSLSSRTIS